MHWQRYLLGDDGADEAVTATFTQIIHDLSISVDPAGGGTTNPSAGVHSYADGAIVEVTATPAAGYQFEKWSGACTGSGTCSVTTSAAKAVTANFVQEWRVLSFQRI